MNKLQNIQNSVEQCYIENGNATYSISVTTQPISTNKVKDALPNLLTSSKEVKLAITIIAQQVSDDKELDEKAAKIHLDRESIKFLNSVQDSTLEETKVWAVAFKTLFPSADITFALKAASRLPTMAKAKFLIEELKVNPHGEIDGQSGPLLRFAARNGNLELVQYLVNDLKANIDHSHFIDATSEAAQDGHYDVAKFLIQKKALLFEKKVISDTLMRACEEGSSLAYFGVISGKLQMVKLLVEDGAPIFDYTKRYPNFDYSSSFNTALAHDQLDVIKYLSKKGAVINRNLNDKDEDPIFGAAKSGSYNVYKYFIEELKLDISNLAKENFKDFLYSIVSGGNVEMLAHFLDRFKIGNEELAKAIHSNLSIRHMPWWKLPMLRYLIEKRRLSTDDIDTDKESNSIEVNAYIYSLDNQGSLAQICNKVFTLGIPGCSLTDLKGIYHSEIKPHNRGGIKLRIIARQKIVQLFFVGPLLKTLANRINQDIAEEICSYLDVPSMATYFKRNKTFRKMYRSEFKKTFWNRMFISIPDELLKNKKVTFTLTI